MSKFKFIKIPETAKQFSWRNDLLCRGRLDLPENTVCVLFVERLGPRWAIYLRRGKARSHRIFFPSQIKAKEAWEALGRGDISPVLEHDRYQPSDKSESSPKTIKTNSELARWMFAYMETSGVTDGKIIEANRLIARLMSENMDIMSPEWWGEHIPEKWQAKEIFKKSKDIVAVLKRTRNHDSKGNRGYLSSRFRLLSNALVYARLMNEDVYPYKSFDKLADAIRIAFRGLSSSDFKPKGNYRPISISDLDLLLKAAAKQGIEYYNYAVLSLSTLIRYKDLKYISREHLGSDGRLIYNKPVRGRYLSSKTVESGKIDPARLVNPTASLVTRIILRHLKFKAFDAKVEKALFSVNSDVRASMSSHGKKYAVRRTLRTTGATMLSESGNSEECRKITRKETMERLAHVNEMMLLTI